MDYIAIGKRIRKARKACGLSQEELAEKINISTTHMSHIETGNTKLSLPVLADLAAVLRVTTDSLLNDELHLGDSTLKELSAVLRQCTPLEAQALTELLKAVKTIMEKYQQPC